MAWVGLSQRLNNDPFAGLINFRDKIVAVLAADSNPINIEAGTIDNRARLPRGLNSRV